MSTITPPDTPDSVAPSARPARVLVVGAAYAGVAALVTLIKLIDGQPARPCMEALPDLNGIKPRHGIEVIVLDERDGYFHSVGAPLAHTSSAHVKPLWRTFKSIRALQHPAIKFVQGTLNKLDCADRVATYTSIDGLETKLGYDCMLLTTGQRREWPILPKALTKAEYIRHADDHIKRISSSLASDGKKVVVIGGGAVGIEFAGEIKVNHPALDVVLVHSRQQLLSAESLPSDFKDRALTLLREEGVEVILGQRAQTSSFGDEQKVVLADGTELTGHVINAIGKQVPSTNFLSPDILDEHGFVKASSTLSFPESSPNGGLHFAAGDVLAWSGVRRAGTAMIMGQVAVTNLYRALLLLEHTSDASAKSFPDLSVPAVPITSDAPAPTEPHIATPESPSTPTEAKELYDIRKTKPGTFPSGVPPMMGLAIGKQAVAYNPYNDELTYGPDVLKALFADDLGWERGLTFLGLTEFDEE